MISKLFIENYRSIRKAELPLSKINVLTGANNSGKSSVLFAAMTLKSLVSNPNRKLDDILTFPFLNLGGFEQIVFLKDKENILQLGCEVKYLNEEIQFRTNLSPKGSSIFLNGLKPYRFQIALDIGFPYPNNKITTIEYSHNEKVFEINWNGIHVSNIKIKGQEGLTIEEIRIRNMLESFINSPAKWVDKIDIVPIKRGFTQPFFGTVPLKNEITTEEEIATLIALDRDLEGEIAHHLEKIVDRVFNVRFTGGISNFYLQTRDKKTGFTSDLVNEGSGVNQLVTILAKTLKKGSDVICIDEPEIHLHPTYLTKFAEVLAEIGRVDNKQFLISTHSEHFLSSFLNLLVSKKINPEDLNVFHCTKPQKETLFELQKVNEKGQISGGLKSFIDAETENLKTFFKIN